MSLNPQKVKKSILTLADRGEVFTRNSLEAYLENRRERVFTRPDYLDYPALDIQIKEKAKALETQAVKKQQVHEDEKNQLYVQQKKELELDMIKRIQAADEICYRTRYQRAAYRREYDLNDPDRLRNAEPTRKGDEDLRLGISSMQIFEGEETMKRKKFREQQRRQQVAFWAQQEEEKLKEKMIKEQKDAEYYEKCLLRNGLLNKMAAQDARLTHAWESHLIGANALLAAQKREKDKLWRKQNNENDMHELKVMEKDPMLNQDNTTADAKDSLDKKVAYQYRGKTDEEMAEFRQDQLTTYKENQAKRLNSLYYEEEQAKHQADLDRFLNVQTIKFERERERLNQEIWGVNKRLADLKRDNDKREAKALREEYASEKFFTQWNVSGR